MRPQQHWHKWSTSWRMASLILITACSHSTAAVLLSERPGNVLTLILTDCAEYQDWQTIAAAFAWRQSGQPGSVVRVANCKEEDRGKVDQNTLDYVETYIAKQYAWYEPLKDWYAAYNKPGAVVDYFEHNNPKEEWVVVLDSDMLLKTPFVPEQLPLERGWAYAAHYDYLVGVDNDLALRHVPEVPARNDTFGGPAGRRGDRVGGPYYMHRDDLKHLAPQWLNYTYIMRGDMEAYKDSGDTASKKGDRIWIAEMYGYSFGAAKSDVWHKWHNDFMLYPSYSPSHVPHVMHYGLIYRVGDWQFDKHWYFDFDVHKCTPWDLSGKPKAGIFPPPPYPDKLPKKDFLSYYTDLLAISVISVVNAGMCDYHVHNCPPSPQLTAVCDEVFKLYHAIDSELKDAEWKWDCSDHLNCKEWVDSGKCEQDKQFMTDNCKESCKYCTPKDPRPKDDVKLHPLSVAAISKEIGVTPAQADQAAAEAEAKKAAEAQAAADREAAEKAAAEKAAAEKAAADKAAAEKEAADKAAADKAAAEKKAADKAAADKAAAEKAAAEKAAADRAAAEKEAADKAAADKAAAEKEAADKAAADKAAAEKAAADKAAADKAAAEKEAAEKEAADKAAAEKEAAEKAAAEKSAADKATADKLPADAADNISDLQGKYPKSALGYSALVKRCTRLQGLGNRQLQLCLKAASYKLLYTDGSSGHDLAFAHSSLGGQWEQMLGDKDLMADGSWGLAEHVFVVVGVMVCAYIGINGIRRGRTKHDRLKL